MTETPSTSPLNTRRGIIAVIIGLGSGFLAGLLGIGGGVVKVPLYVFGLAMNQFIAAGTSVASNVASAGSGVVAFGVDGSIVWSAVAIVFIGASVGAWYGARHLDLIPEWALAGVFSLVMFVAAVRMWF